jgi:PAS domain S-box-containing protein
MFSVATVLTFGLLAALWAAILAVYLRQRRAARARDPLVAMLLGVLALDAFKSFVESVWFGLAWGYQYGLFGTMVAFVTRPGPMLAVKLLNVAVAAVVLTRLARQWVPTQLIERERHRSEEARLRAELERSLAEARENEESFRLAAEVNEHAVWDLDLRTGKLWLSRRHFDMLGHHDDGWSGDFDSWREAVHPDDAGELLERFTSVAGPAARGGAGASSYQSTHRMRHADGSYRLVRAQGMPLRDANGDVVRLLGFSRDVTAEAAEEEARLKAQKLETVGLLAGGVAHDFNNLLAVISANLSVVQNRARGDDAQAIGAALAATDRAAMLTRQLLAYGGKARLAKEPVDLSALVRDIAGLFATAVSRKVRTVQELHPALPKVCGDPAQLQQVVMNLVTNAAEAIGDAPGTITILTGERSIDASLARELDPRGGLQPGRCVVLTVSDTGCGMSAETRMRIFDPFFSTKSAGRGLGLSAMAGILRAHGGAVRIESQPGRGSRFEIFLPASAEAARAAPAAPLASAGALHGTILLVEDEPLVRRSSVRLLTVLGLRAVEAQNGAEAVKLVASDANAFDAVLMDLMMPEMNGIEALAAIRRIREDLPVILTSGFTESPIEAVPGTSFLAKPYDLAQVERALRSALPQA